MAEMAPEPPVGVDAHGRLLYSYRELVRRNVVKGDALDPALTGGLAQGCLELYLEEGEFNERFGMTKEEFSKVPRWRQAEVKKSLMLF